MIVVECFPPCLLWNVFLLVRFYNVFYRACCGISSYKACCGLVPTSLVGLAYNSKSCILAHGADDADLDLAKTLKFVEAKEAGKRSSNLLITAGGLNKMSDFQKRKFEGKGGGTPPVTTTADKKKCGWWQTNNTDTQGEVQSFQPQV